MKTTTLSFAISFLSKPATNQASVVRHEFLDTVYWFNFLFYIMIVRLSHT